MRNGKVVNIYTTTRKHKVVTNPYNSKNVPVAHYGHHRRSAPPSRSSSQHLEERRRSCKPYYKSSCESDKVKPCASKGTPSSGTEPPSYYQKYRYSHSSSLWQSVPNPYKCHEKQDSQYSSTKFQNTTAPNSDHMHLSSEALVQKARVMVTSYDFIQHQRKVPMSKKEAAIRHMRKKVEEQKVERFKAEMAAQHDRNKLREDSSLEMSDQPTAGSLQLLAGMARPSAGSLWPLAELDTTANN